MPYYIEQGCDGKPEWWAVKDIAGDAFGCHESKQGAIDQGVAISLADDEEFLGENKPEDRNADGEPIIISDIDDTLIHAGERVDRVWNFIQSEQGALFIVTGRPESQRADTEAQLEDLDITYSRLIMNAGSTADSAEFKKLTAESLLETYDVVMAVENDIHTLAVYSSLGIEAIDPADISADPNMGERFAKLGEYTTEGNAVKTFESRVSTADFELRAEGDGMTFSGYAAVFDSPSQPLPFIERIAPGAFTRSLKARNDIKLLWNHDSSIVLGSTRAKTLTLTEDERGLKVTAVLPNTSAGRDAAELLKRGDVNAMSFGFTVPPKGDQWSADGNERTLRAVSLHEVSIVAWPAYTATAGTASVRSFIKTAQRAEVDADALAEALVKLEAGDDITADDRNLLTTVIDKLAPLEVAEPVDGIGDMARLALKRKKLELLKGFSA
jgi:HK97 family phage prohead protease